MPDDSVEMETEQDAELIGEQDAVAESDEQSPIEEVAQSPSPQTEQSDGDGGTEATEANPGWASQLQEAGFQTFDEVDDAVRALVESNRQRDAQIQQYAEQVRFYQDQRNFGEQQQQPASAEQPVQQEKDPLTQIADEWVDPAWAQQFIETDEEGNRVISPNVDDETRDRIMAADRGVRKWQEVIQNPQRFAEAVDARVNQMIEEKFNHSYEQRQAQAQEEMSIDSFINSNSEWLYARDPATGEYVQDAVTGNFSYTQDGMRFLQAWKEVKDQGVASVPSQIEYAMLKTGLGGVAGSQQPQQQAKQATTADAIQGQRNAMRGRRNTARAPQKQFSGVSAESGGDPAGREQMSFGEETLAVMKTLGQ